METKRILVWSLLLTLLAACSDGGDDDDDTAPVNDDDVANDDDTVPPPPDRLASIPDHIVKVNPEEDPLPPIVEHPDWEPAVPLPAPITTAGSEDSPFVAWEGDRLFFWFTPDPHVPAQETIGDQVTGIWQTRLDDGAWSEPQRVWLGNPDEEALDGCPVWDGRSLWFCSARAGGPRGLDIWRAEEIPDGWSDPVLAPERWNGEWAVGEFHITPDGQTLVFDRPQTGQAGPGELWMTTKGADGEWREPWLIDELSTSDSEHKPYLTPDGAELWFTRDEGGVPGIWRSLRGEGDAWLPPERIVYPLAGEPTLDRDGNLYFVHPLFRGETIEEFDIYFAHHR